MFSIVFLLIFLLSITVLFFRINPSSPGGLVKMLYQRFIDIYTRKYSTSIDAAAAGNIVCTIVLVCIIKILCSRYQIVDTFIASQAQFPGTRVTGHYQIF